MGGSDYTILIPLDLSREQMQEAERLMRKLGEEVKGKVDYVDWYPHGWKNRIEPHGDISWQEGVRKRTINDAP